MNIVFAELFVVCTLALGAYAWSHFFFWGVERIVRFDAKRSAASNVKR